MSTSRLLLFAPSTSASAPSSSSCTPTYSLLALPSSVLSVLQSDNMLELRAHGTDAAVLVTVDQTYSIRGVQNSNSILLCDTQERVQRKNLDALDEELQQEQEEDLDTARGKNKRRKLDSIVIEATLHETLELLPSVPRFDQLYGILSSIEYDGEDSELDRAARTPVTLSALSSLLPASDGEIAAALRLNRVVVLEDQSIRFIAHRYRLKCLSPLLRSLISTKAKAKGKEKEEKKSIVASIKLDDMMETMDAVDCSEEIARRIVEWYGEPSESDPTRWIMSIEDLVREIGICVLVEGGHTEQPLRPFLAKWQQYAHNFSSLCLLTLLSETSLLPSTTTIRYFPPSNLSPSPSIRFAELFAIKPRWTEAEMTPFINDLVGGDRKKREAMALKFVRKVLEKGKPTVWSARNAW